VEPSEPKALDVETIGAMPLPAARQRQPRAATWKNGFLVDMFIDGEQSLAKRLLGTPFVCTPFVGIFSNAFCWHLF
jgi:hypothetical protein